MKFFDFFLKPSMFIRVYPWRNFFLIFLPVVSLLFVLRPAVVSAREATLTILFTNDHHGQVEPLEGSNPTGGVARRMALIEKIRAEVGAKNVLLVDGGDLFADTPLSSLTHGEVDCAAYQLMKYDAIALGNHDFDYGKSAILDYRRRFGVPWISANVLSHSQPFVRAYVLKNAGVRVGLIGLSPSDTSGLAHRESAQGLLFNSPGQTAKGLHSIFKKDADLFVVLSRLGVDADKKFAQDNSFVHVVIGGFSQTLMTEPILIKSKDGTQSTIIAQAGSRGLYLGRLDLTVKGRRDPKTKNAKYTVEDFKYKLIPVRSDLPEDPKMVALLDKYKGKLSGNALDEPLANVSGDLTKTSEGDSLIGEIATDAVREAAGAEAALLNNGSFHPEFKSGNLTRQVLYQIMPFDDEVVVLEMTGSALRRVLEASLKRKGGAGFLQVSGLKIKKDGETLQVNLGDSPLEDKRLYKVAVNDFLSRGGSGYDAFRRAKSRQKTQVMIRELLEKDLKGRQKVFQSDMDKRWQIP